MVAIQGLVTSKFGKQPANRFFNAPYVIFLVKHRLHISDPDLDMGICGQNMILAAHSLGFGTYYVGFAPTALNMDSKTKKKLRTSSALNGLTIPYQPVSRSVIRHCPWINRRIVSSRKFAGSNDDFSRGNMLSQTIQSLNLTRM